MHHRGFKLARSLWQTPSSCYPALIPEWQRWVSLCSQDIRSRAVVVVCSASVRTTFRQKTGWFLSLPVVPTPSPYSCGTAVVAGLARSPPGVSLHTCAFPSPLQHTPREAVCQTGVRHHYLQALLDLHYLSSDGKEKMWNNKKISASTYNKIDVKH